MRALSTYSLPTLFVVAFGVVVGIALLVTASTSTAAFGAFNTEWDGTAELRSLTETTETPSQVVQNTSTYTAVHAPGTIAFIFAPEQPYQRHEIAQIRRFVQRGGTLVVADERTGPANDLLAAVGADARIDGVPLRDGRQHYRAPVAPLVTPTTSHPTLRNVQTLTLNHGTAVVPQTATPLVTTSGYAYRDTNRNHTLDQTETVGQYPVVTVESVKAGTVIVAGDPSLFINTMQTQGDNRQFARNLVTTHERVLFDYSHTAALPPAIQLVFFLRRTPLVQFLCGGVGILLIALLRTRPAAVATTMRHLWWAPSPAATACAEDTSISESATDMATAPASPVADTVLVDHLRTQYPDWDDDRLRRIVAARRQQPSHTDATTTSTDSD